MLLCSQFLQHDAHSELVTELVSCVISRLHNGKAPDITGLSAEHLAYSHPALSVLLCKLFRIILHSSYIPTGFKYGYIVPIPMLKESRVKSLSCDDFRGIAIMRNSLTLTSCNIIIGIHLTLLSVDV